MWWWTYLLLALLFGFAIYEHINSTTLSLPISGPLTILLLLLPLFGAANTLFYHYAFRVHNPSRRNRGLAVVLQGFQAIFTIVLATLFFSGVLPSAARSCLLSTTWQRLFSAHDAASIRRTQDAFNCCGFNTVRDRAWPFPNQHGSGSCVETYGRNVACVGPWQMALQRNSSLEFAIAIAVGLLQASSVLLAANSRSFEGVSLRRSNPHHNVHEPERARLLPAVGTSYDGDNSGQDAEQNGRVDTTNDPGRQVEQSHSNPWNSREEE